MQTGTVAVVGLGLIGGSIALDARAAGWPLVATDVDPAQREAADAAGIAVVDRLEDAVVGADLVVVATPALQVAEVLRRTDAARAAPVLATSVASVQATHVLGLQDLQLDRVTHVGGHPMTGTERSGFRAARRGMFDGSPWIVTPRPGDPDRAFRAVIDLALGVRAMPVVLRPEEHDRTVALLSHLPHVLAYTAYRRLLLVDDGGTEHLAGGSFRDVTRVAATRPSFWSEVLHLNRTAVADLVAEVAADLGRVEAALRDEAGGEALEALLAGGHRAVGRPRPRVPDPTPVPDGPLAASLVDELEAHTRAGLAVAGWTPDGGALTWTPL